MKYLQTEAFLPESKDKEEAVKNFWFFFGALVVSLFLNFVSTYFTFHAMCLSSAGAVFWGTLLVIKGIKKC